MIKITILCIACLIVAGISIVMAWTTNRRVNELQEELRDLEDNLL